MSLEVFIKADDNEVCYFQNDWGLLSTLLPEDVNPYDDEARSHTVTRERIKRGVDRLKTVGSLKGNRLIPGKAEHILRFLEPVLELEEQSLIINYSF